MTKAKTIHARAPKKIRILIVDDHKMVRDGIRSMLESQEKKYTFLMEEAENGEEGIEMSASGSFDVIIMDYQLPKMNGVEATKRIIERDSKAKVLALSNYDEYMYIDNMMRAGARGFVLKNIGPEEIINAIEAVMDGRNYYSSDVAVKLISFDHNNIPLARLIKQKRENGEILSERELEILKLIAAEYTNEEIAATLFISKRTVDTHRQNLMKKLDVKNTAGLVKSAIELKILERK
jgi:DNA-binding NarL/FixJ family response regulator